MNVRLRRGRRLAIPIVAIGLFLLWASPASAHSTLERSEPPNGGMVAVGRSTLTLWFTEAINAGASTFALHTLDGVQAATTVSASEADGRGIVSIGTEPLAKATYVLDWAVLADDGHPSRGSVLFGVGIRPVVAPSAGSDLPEAPGLLLRWLDLSAIMLAIGALAVSGRVLGSMGETGSAPRRRARLIGALAAGVAVVSGAITPFLRTHRDGSSLGGWVDTVWATLTGTPWGHVWLAREIALVLAAGALWSWAIRRNGSGGRVQIAAVALAAAVCLESWAGHASALPSRSGLAAFASASHLVAAGVWAGGLAVLALCLMPVMRLDPDTRGPILASALRAFSPMAAIAAVVLLATGLYESGRHIPDVRSVAWTVYGLTVAGKVVLVAVALTMAGINTLLVHPRLAAPVGRILGQPAGWAPVSLRRFTTVVAAEALVLGVAVGAAALLTSVPTAREIGSATRDAAPHSANVEGLFVTFEQVPAGPEKSRLIVRARATVKPEPGPVSGVEVLLVGPTGTTTTVVLERIEPGRYEAETARPTPGAWKASVAVQREDVPAAVTQVGWSVSAAVPQGARPLEVATTGLAVLLLTALVGAVAFTRRRRAHPVRSLPPVGEKSGSQL